MLPRCLDNVLQYFIDNAPATVSRAVYSATRERSIGIGVGFPMLTLQRKESHGKNFMAKSTNIRMFKLIRSRLDEANLELGKERGEALDAEGTSEDLVMLWHRSQC